MHSDRPNAGGRELGYGNAVGGKLRVGALLSAGVGRHNEQKSEKCTTRRETVDFVMIVHSFLALDGEFQLENKLVFKKNFLKYF